jgi:hypothetical protein
VNCLPRHRPQATDLPEQPLFDRNAGALVAGPGPCGSTIAGIRLLGEIARNSGVNCSPLEMSTARMLYGSPHSSSMIEIFQPFGVGQ